MSTQGLLFGLDIDKIDSKTVTGKDVMIPYHRISKISTSNSITTIIVADGSRYRKRYTTVKAISAIETAVGLYTEPEEKFTELTATKINGTVQPAGGTSVFIGEHLILEALDIPTGGMILVVENGTIYNDLYEVSNQKADLTTNIDVA